MRIGPSLILASRQTLAMTPQLQQAIKLLQFSHLELAAFIQQELEKNPLLAEGAADDGPIAEQDAPILDAPSDTAETLAAAAPALAEADERWTREHADRGGDGAASRVGQRDDAPSALDFVSERPRSLAVHVLEQIELMFADAADAAHCAEAGRRARRGGLLPPRCAGRRRGVQRRPRRGRSRVVAPAPDRAGRIVRPHRRGVPGRPARRAQSPRSGDEGPARQSRPGGRGRAGTAAPPLRRRRRGSARDAVGAAHARSAPRPGLRLRADPAGAARSLPAPGQGCRHRRGGLAHRAQHRCAAQGAGRSQLPRHADEGRARQARSRLRRRALPVGQLAGEDARAARHHHPEGRARDRAPAGRLLPPRRRARCVRWCCATSPSPPSCTRAR